MRVIGIRFCAVSPDAEALAGCLGNGLGLPRREMPDAPPDGFSGAVFPAGDSWIEIWPEGAGMPAGTMLQIEVDDADAWAAQARDNGLEPHGPMDAHGKRIYCLQAPGGLTLTATFQFGARE